MTKIAVVPLLLVKPQPKRVSSVPAMLSAILLSVDAIRAATCACNVQKIHTVLTGVILEVIPVSSVQWIPTVPIRTMLPATFLGVFACLVSTTPSVLTLLLPLVTRLLVLVSRVTSMTIALVHFCLVLLPSPSLVMEVLTLVYNVWLRPIAFPVFVTLLAALVPRVFSISIAPPTSLFVREQMEPALVFSAWWMSIALKTVLFAIV